MEKLNTFVKQARLKGRSDEQISQFLASRGVSEEQINIALGFMQAAPKVPSFQPQAPKKSRIKQIPNPVKKVLSLKLPVLIGFVSVLVIGAGSGYAILKHDPATSSKDAELKLIAAMQNQDKGAADALLSNGAKTQLKEKSGTDSFYDACLKDGSLCTPLFKYDYIARSQKTETAYTSETGAKGRETKYTVKRTLGGSAACKGDSISTLTISTISKGDNWLVDKVTPQFDSAAAACP